MNYNIKFYSLPLVWFVSEFEIQKWDAVFSFAFHIVIGSLTVASMYITLQDKLKNRKIKQKKNDATTNN